MVRGSGKFKQKRGGGRNFSKNMVLDENGTAVSTDKPRRSRRDDASDDEEDSEEAEGESEEESEEESGGEDKPELTRAERRDLKKKQAAAKQQTEGDEEDADLINPNHVTKKMNISDLGAKIPTRREREQKEKQDAKDRYWKLHLAGKTDQAKADLARLAKIREEREVANAKRQAEAEAKAVEAAAKKAAQEGRGSSRT